MRTADLQHSRGVCAVQVWPLEPALTRWNTCRSPSVCWCLSCRSSRQGHQPSAGGAQTGFVRKASLQVASHGGHHVAVSRDACGAPSPSNHMHATPCHPAHRAASDPDRGPVSRAPGASRREPALPVDGALVVDEQQLVLLRAAGGTPGRGWGTGYNQPTSPNAACSARGGAWPVPPTEAITAACTRPPAPSPAC
jgi:hypothetical protein